MRELHIKAAAGLEVTAQDVLGMQRSTEGWPCRWQIIQLVMQRVYGSSKQGDAVFKTVWQRMFHLS